MEFEFDETKSAANKAKHGLDFSEAQKLWQDVDAVEIPAKSDIEQRKMLVARIERKIWAAVFTERENKVRIISVRRARTSEEAIYEQTEDQQQES
ncbi:MAG: BrnT family toxin [Verrucomicrobiota bacterium]